MHNYSIFGGCLRSEIPFAELRPGRDTGRGWTLHVTHTRSSLPPTELLGTDEVMEGVDVRLYRRPQDGAYRMVYDDTGSFDISPDGRDIRWAKGPTSWEEAARLDFINRVLPVALHASGTFCLHGSAVSFNEGAIAFLAPRGYGKSTLALALLTSGARIVTDDALALDLQNPVMAWPGLHSVRLMDDSAQAVIGDVDKLQAVGAYPMPRRDLHQLADGQPVITKQILRGLPEHQLMLDAVPLAAVYVLVPIRSAGAEDAAVRIPLPAVQAAMSLVEHAKSGVLLGKSEAAVLFDRAVRVAQAVPVYRLNVARDLTRIAEVAEQLAQWHQSPQRRQAPSAPALAQS